jgi:hypothetical protein
VSAVPPLRAPAGDGEIVVVPPLEQVGELLEANRRQQPPAERTLLGQSWQELRRLSRAEVVGWAIQHAGPSTEKVSGPFFAAKKGPDTFSVEGPDRTRAPTSDLPFFLAGHQPELFHPGVWLKNFALAGLGRRHGGVAINLLVDNDTLKSAALRVPVPASEALPRPHTVTIAFDRWLAEVPFEERRVEDDGLFASFGERVTEALAGWGYEPIIRTFWPDVLRHAGNHGLIGASFAAARRDLERRWGCHNLEVPLSLVCAGEGFAWFVGALLDDLARFTHAYNDVVSDYRARHGIRDRHHPVPNLASDGDWLEAPLWGWRVGQPRRHRLFARLDGERLQLRAGEETWPDLPVPSAANFIDVWRGLEGAGYKVRSRALTTTLFARLFLADLFMHGIGGGKYDELTDELIRRFFGLEPPAFMVLSGTRWLPLPTFAVDEDNRRRLAAKLRGLHFNPQRYLSAEQSAKLEDLLAQRQWWIEHESGNSPERRKRFAELRSINEQLHEPLAEEDERTRQELARITEQLNANAVLHRRDYSFCLYPESVLRPFCTRLA